MRPPPLSRAAAVARPVAAELPFLVVVVVLLSTAADVLPPDSLLSVGELRLDLARLLILVGLGALVWTEGARRELFRTGVGLPLALLLAVSLIASAKWDTWARYRFLVESVALFYLAFAVLRARPQARQGLVLAALIALAAVSLVAVAQVSQDEATGFYRVSCVPVTQAPPSVPEDATIRAIGTFANPNVLAGYVLLLAPLALLALAGAGQAIQTRMALGAAVAVGYLALLLTYSRSGVLMAVLALTAAAAVSRLPRRGHLLAIGAVLALGALSLLASCGSESTAGYGRWQEWQDTVEAIRDEPLVGVGLGRIGAVLNANDARSTATHAHNLLLTWWAEAGPGALLAWLWLLAALGWRSARAARRGALPAGAALAAVAGFAAFSMLDHPANIDRVATTFWIVAAIAAAAGAGALRSDRAEG